MKSIFYLLIITFTTGPVFGEQAELWQALRDKTHFAIIRHAMAPGTGDPANFDLNDCSTQRNLSDKGKAQAQRIGDAFRKNGMTRPLVFTSQWCRCKETAKLMNLGRVLEFWALNSFFSQPENKEKQMRELRSFIQQKTPLVEVLVMVTHQVVITELTDIVPRSGEMIVARWNPKSSKFEVLGTTVIE